MLFGRRGESKTKWLWQPRKIHPYARCVGHPPLYVKYWRIVFYFDSFDFVRDAIRLVKIDTQYQMPIMSWNWTLLQSRISHYVYIVNQSWWIILNTPRWYRQVSCCDARNEFKPALLHCTGVVYGIDSWRVLCTRTVLNVASSPPSVYFNLGFLLSPFTRIFRHDFFFFFFVECSWTILETFLLSGDEKRRWKKQKAPTFRTASREDGNKCESGWRSCLGDGLSFWIIWGRQHEKYECICNLFKLAYL